MPEDAPETFDRVEEEKETFSRQPWTQIPVKQRGTTELKRFLATTLSSRIRKAFPEVQRKIELQLKTEKEFLESLGKERLSREQRREYLYDILGRYHELALDALKAPERLPSDAMKLRGLTQKAMKNFAKVMKLSGHYYDFVDVSDIQHDEAVQRSELYVEISNQISVNRGEELSGMINPAVLRPLLTKQTSKWESIGQDYLEEVITTSKKVALLILELVSLEFGIPDHTKIELERMIDGFESQARNVSIEKLSGFCLRKSTFLLATTDQNFENKIKATQCARFAAALLRYRTENPPEKFFPANIGLEEPKLLSKINALVPDWVIIDTKSISALFSQIHPRATRNTQDEIHDLLKAYYEVSAFPYKHKSTSKSIETTSLLSL